MHGINAIRADLLLLLQTSPGERVMLPTYGTKLNSILFDQNDGSAISGARNIIIEARIAVRIELLLSSKYSNAINICLPVGI